MSNGDSYRPPKSYWEEIEKLDAQILALSEPSPVKNKISHIPVKTRHALWAGLDENSIVYWRRFGFVFGNSISSLWKYEKVPVDPLAEGLANAEVNSDHGYYGSNFIYALGWLMKRAVHLDFRHVIGPSHTDTQPYTNESRALDGQVGLFGPDKTAYDELEVHLRRGASGEFSMPLHETET